MKGECALFAVALNIGGPVFDSEVLVVGCRRTTLRRPRGETAKAFY